MFCELIMEQELEPARESDADLLEKFVHGDVGAFEQLFRQFQGQVYGWIVRIVRDPAAAEDLTIEVFWRIYRARARFDTGRSFGAWARRIATNAAIDYLKSASRESALEESVQPAAPETASSEDMALVRHALDSLPAKFRAIALLALVEETPYAEIAEATGLSVSGVKSRVFRAVRMLRKKLNRLGMQR